MSQLPVSANLEHLKKQARRLLPELQREKPSLTLSDALHAVAREYGFASWAKLKDHVESSSRASVVTNPFAGAWIANPSRSKQHPDNPFRAAAVTITVDGDRYTIAHTVTGAAGPTDGGTHVIVIDGQDHAVSERYVLTARRIASRAFEAVVTADGIVAGRTVYEVSANGLTMTVSARNAGANGAGWQTDFDQVILFERAPGVVE